MRVLRLELQKRGVNFTVFPSAPLQEPYARVMDLTPMRRRHRRRNPDDPRDRIERLALSFPTLRWARGVAPFDPNELDAWACGPASSGGFHAAAFILGVWNHYADWGCGKFDLFRAFDTWDREHREAFVAWAQDPWTA